MTDLGLFQWSVRTVSEDHAEGDALGLRGEGPGHCGATAVHTEREATVTTGLDEELSITVPKRNDVVQ